MSKMPEEEGTVLLRLTGPAYCTAMRFPGDGEATLVIDRRGTVVLKTDAPALIETAAKHGVTLTESEQ